VAKKLAIMHLKPKIVPHLAKQGLEWADVVPELEEVDSIDELKEAIEHPMAFLDRISKAGAESLGIAISASLCVLNPLAPVVVPAGQGARSLNYRVGPGSSGTKLKVQRCFEASAFNSLMVCLESPITPERIRLDENSHLAQSSKSSGVSKPRHSN
jgi:hypothetical protein